MLGDVVTIEFHQGVDVEQQCGHSGCQHHVAGMVPDDSGISIYGGDSGQSRDEKFGVHSCCCDARPPPFGTKTPG